MGKYIITLTKSTNNTSPRAISKLTLSSCNTPTQQSKQVSRKQCLVKALTHSINNKRIKEQMRHLKKEKLMINMINKIFNPPITISLSLSTKLLSTNNKNQVHRSIDQLSNSRREIVKNHLFLKCHNLNKTRVLFQVIQTTRHCFQVQMHLIFQSKRKATNRTSTLKSCRVPHKIKAFKKTGIILQLIHISFKVVKKLNKKEQVLILYRTKTVQKTQLRTRKVKMIAMKIQVMVKVLIMMMPVNLNVNLKKTKKKIVAPFILQKIMKIVKCRNQKCHI